MKQRLIDANALHYRMGVNQDDKQIFYVTGEDIDAAPTIDLESLRPRGHWEKETVDGPDVVKYTSLLSVFCSRCRRRAWMKSTYCPHCGSFMENKNGENYVKK